MVFQQILYEKADLICQVTAPAMVPPASSDKWKVPLKATKCDGSFLYKEYLLFYYYYH